MYFHTWVTFRISHVLPQPHSAHLPEENKAQKNSFLRSVLTHEGVTCPPAVGPGL